MKNYILGLMALVVSFLNVGCASSRMDVRERVELPVLLNGQVYTNSFERTDRSKIAPGGPRTIRQGSGVSLFRFNAAVGGGGGYGGSYGYPMINVPLESQGAFQSQTYQRYGLGGGYHHAPAGSYSPAPVVGGR